MGLTKRRFGENTGADSPAGGFPRQSAFITGFGSVWFCRGAGNASESGVAKLKPTWLKELRAIAPMLRTTIYWSFTGIGRPQIFSPVQSQPFVPSALASHQSPSQFLISTIPPPVEAAPRGCVNAGFACMLMKLFLRSLFFHGAVIAVRVARQAATGAYPALGTLASRNSGASCHIPGHFHRQRRICVEARTLR